LQDLWLLDIPLFSGLERIHLAKLIPELERASFPAGETLFRQGDPGTCLYIIIDGEADVFLEDGETGTRSVAVLGRRECFGEMALLTGQPRSGERVRALERPALRGGDTRPPFSAWTRGRSSATS
jgi:CRP-like cAMP-binding protein